MTTRIFLVAMVLGNGLALADDPPIVDSILHSNEPALATAIRGLRALSPEERPAVLAALVRILNSDNWFDRQRAAYALGEMGSTAASAIPDLSKKIDEHEAAIRLQSAVALYKITGAHNDEAFNAILESMEYPGSTATESPRLTALRLVDELGPKTKEFLPAILVRAYTETDPEIQKKAAAIYQSRGSGKLIDRADVKPLLAVLSDDRPGLRRMAASALGKLPDGAREYHSRLMNMLQDKDPLVRVAAAEALCKNDFVSKKSLGVLTAGLSDSRLIVRHAAARSLAVVGPPAKDAVPALISALGDAESLLESRRKAQPERELEADHEYRILLDLPYSISTALRRVGTPEALAALKEHEAKSNAKR